MSDIKFVDGLIVKPPHEKAPDFVKCAISIKVADLMNWLKSQDSQWVNLDVKTSREGKWYAAINDWKPDKQINETERAQNQTTRQWVDEHEATPDFDDDLGF